MKGTPISILLIEDSVSDATLLRELLKRVYEFNFEMEHVTTIARGAEKIIVRGGSYDAIILDLELPDAYGVESYEKTRTIAPKTPIIIISGNEDRDIMSDVLNRGADNYLIKDAFDGNRVAIAVLSSIRNRLK